MENKEATVEGITKIIYTYFPTIRNLVVFDAPGGQVKWTFLEDKKHTRPKVLKAITEHMLRSYEAAVLKETGQKIKATVDIPGARDKNIN